MIKKVKKNTPRNYYGFNVDCFGYLVGSWLRGVRVDPRVVVLLSFPWTGGQCHYPPVHCRVGFVDQALRFGYLFYFFFFSLEELGICSSFPWRFYGIFSLHLPFPPTPPLPGAPHPLTTITPSKFPKLTLDIVGIKFIIVHILRKQEHIIVLLIQLSMLK